MNDSNGGRTVGRRRFDPAQVRVDPAWQANYVQTRGAQVGRLLGRLTPYDLPLPWLTLNPASPMVAGKGWLEYTMTNEIKMGQYEDGPQMYAAFDLVFEKNEGGFEGSAFGRPNVTICLTDPPTPTVLVEMDVATRYETAGGLKFEVQTNPESFVLVDRGHRRTVHFLMQERAVFQVAWTDGNNHLQDRPGEWWFWEARMTSLNI